MSFDLSGNYTLPAGNPVVAGTLITAAQFNATMADLATALSQVILADGRKAFSGTIVASLFQGPVTGNVTGNLVGNVTGTTASFSGGVTAGSFSGALTGNVTGTTGTFSGGVTAASFSGNLSGTSATLSGAMTAATVSLSGGGLTLQGNQLSNLSLASAAGQAVPYQQLFSQGVPLDIAAAATLNVGAQNTAFLRMTGTGTAITSFGTAYNGPRFITVVGTGNSLIASASLETHTGANVALGAGDTFVVVPKATTSGTPDGWRVVGYQAYGTTALPATQAAVQGQAYKAFTTGGSGTAYTLTPAPAITAYAENQEFDVEFHTASSGTPTINVSGLGARDLQWYTNAAGALGSVGANIPAGFRSRVTYDGSVFVVRDRPFVAYAPVNYISGMTLSHAFTNLTVSTGSCVDSTNSIVLELPSGITKGTGSWAVGSGPAVGGLDTGTIANNTWYFVHVIRRPDTGVVDALLSLSATAPTMPTNYTQRRLVGVWRYASGIFEDWYQVGRQIRYKTPVQDFNAVSATAGARAARTITVPTTVNVFADIGVGLATGNNGGLYISDLSTNDVMTALGSGLHQGGTHAAASFGGRCWVRTSTSGQVGERVSSGPATFSLYTFGFDMTEMLGL